ncbi:hypothetical protein B0I72DRAFT_142157 [Yarrowia lipolytica]|uniref:Uncharacterized protein n=1 Tax=Yarrowia lipolytica TaxID=4952 RepID=A0A371C3G0_YARLL|nr:hypothetical protein BKA91DRAFT_137305 [Yarrowia lipolytica]KAE8173879.1 hypothetical protein BKA90DRAFT_134813 [Yarrowia lipolytica]KAJ8053048.1 hypothetical protein LXG23DRAFT_54640 [Yarrowia lipolytica]QNP97465.1 Non-classical export protein 1 [Yarrowia lipolytica]RDW24831.1 hypothetical protein B0I71DRAFT_133623 [Yarrowia lipolytica]
MAPIKYPYLLSKWLDPLFAVTIGVLAYGVFEQRHGRQEGHRLIDLVQRKWDRDINGNVTNFLPIEDNKE